MKIFYRKYQNLEIDIEQQRFQRGFISCGENLILQPVTDLRQTSDLRGGRCPQLIEQHAFQILKAGGHARCGAGADRIGGDVRHKVVEVAAVALHELPDEGSTRDLSGRHSGIVRLIALDGKRLNLQLHRDHRLEVFDREDIVRRTEQHPDLIAVGLADENLQCLWVRITELHQIFQLRTLCAGIGRLDRSGEQPKIAALTAEGQLIHTAQPLENIHGTFGIGLGSTQAVRDRQLNHEVCAAAHRCLRTLDFVDDGDVAALHEVSAHDRDNMRRAVLARLLDMIEMPVVERVVFTDDSADFH